jgi:hypothetical protein
MKNKYWLVIGPLLTQLMLPALSFAQSGRGGGGGGDIEPAGYVAKYMNYHYKAAGWLQQFYGDGTLAKKLSLDQTKIFTNDGRLVTADLLMNEFNLGSNSDITVEFLPHGHKVNERITNLPGDRICGNIPAQKLIICSIDQWKLTEQGIGDGDYTFGSAIFGALDIHERLAVMGHLEQNDGPVSQYPISSQILKYRHVARTVDFDYTDQLFSEINQYEDKDLIVVNDESSGYDFTQALDIKYNCKIAIYCTSHKGANYSCNGRRGKVIYMKSGQNGPAECVAAITQQMRQTQFFGGGCSRIYRTNAGNKVGANNGSMFWGHQFYGEWSCDYENETDDWKNLPASIVSLPDLN